MNAVMESTYLPFTDEQLMNYLSMVRHRGECVRNEEHLSYFKNRIKRCHRYLADNPTRAGRSLSELKVPCHIEEDEPFVHLSKT